MIKLLSILLVLFVEISAFATMEQKPTDEKTDTFIRQKLSPFPKDLKIFDGIYILNENSTISISVANELSKKEKKTIAYTIKKYWRISPKIEYSINSQNIDLGLEGSETEISDKGISIAAKDFTAIRQALKTLRQFAEAERDGNGQVFAFASIKDYATLKFRGMHFCIFPETTLQELEKYVRLASYYKFNHLVIEPWGVFPFKSHPEFAYSDKKLNRSDFKKIIDLCWEEGITPIPQFSVLGHAAQSRQTTSKHAVIGEHPELANVFEPLGWSYCMSSQKTERILKDLIAEIHEFYGNPPYIHLGCDEAYDKATCYKCRKESFVPLFVKHLSKFNKFVKERGARAIIWHDMLLNKQEKRWEQHVATGDAETIEALKLIDKDVIIADWQYSWKYIKFTKFESPKHFKDAGFDVIVCPWDRNGGVTSLARIAKNENLFGFLETTWHHLFNNNHYYSFFWHSGNAAWNGGEHNYSGKLISKQLPFISQISQVISDMEEAAYETAGTSENQISKSVRQ